jgi:hypothetical protein
MRLSVISFIKITSEKEKQSSAPHGNEPLVALGRCSPGKPLKLASQRSEMEGIFLNKRRASTPHGNEPLVALDGAAQKHSLLASLLFLLLRFH